MALQKTMALKDNFEKEIVFTNAYIRVESVSGGKENLGAFVATYDQKDGKQLTVKSITFVPSMDGSNFIKQAYEHLKTLPEFAGAQDC